MCMLFMWNFLWGCVWACMHIYTYVRCSSVWCLCVVHVLCMWGGCAWTCRAYIHIRKVQQSVRCLCVVHVLCMWGCVWACMHIHIRKVQLCEMSVCCLCAVYVRNISMNIPLWCSAWQSARACQHTFLSLSPLLQIGNLRVNIRFWIWVCFSR